MTSTCVIQLVRWLRRADQCQYDYKQITLFNLFVAAYWGHFAKVNEPAIQADIALFAKEGQIPFYVVLFLKGTLYPKLLYQNANPQPPLIE